MEEKIETLRIKVTTIDQKERILLGKDKAGTGYYFLYESSTKIKILSPSEVILPVSSYQLQKKPLPIKVDQDIVVSWKTDPKTSRRTVVEFVLLE